MNGQRKSGPANVERDVAAHRAEADHTHLHALPLLRFVHRASSCERKLQRLRERRAEGEAPACEIILKIVNCYGWADLEFEEGRPAGVVDAKVHREAVAKADQPLQARCGRDDRRDRLPRAPVRLAAKIDHVGDESRRSFRSEAAARALRVLGARTGFRCPSW